jgi:hypothetical protein
VTPPVEATNRIQIIGRRLGVDFRHQSKTLSC